MSKKSKKFRRSIRMNGRLISKTFTRKSDAERWYLEKLREKELLRGGLSLPTHEKLFGEFTVEWLNHRKAQGKPESSWKSDEERIKKYLVPSFANRKLSQISHVEWERAIDAVVKAHNRTPSTRNRVRTVIHTLLADAVRKGLLISNPISKIPKWKENSRKWSFFETAIEVEKYLCQSLTESTAFQVFATLSLNLGVRPGELMALCFSDINFENKTVRIAKTYEHSTKSVQIRTKSNRSRTLGLNSACIDILVKHRSNTVFNNDDDLVLSEKRLAPLSKERLRTIHNRVIRKEGLKKIRLYDLKHTFASHYMMNGGNIYDLKDILGHSSVSMTQKYAHLSQGHLQSLANVVSFEVLKNNEKNIFSLSSRSLMHE